MAENSWHGQRIGDALAVEIDDGVMDGLVEGGDVCEGLVGEVMGLKIAPDRLDFIEFGGVFRQPLDGEPVCAGGQGGERAFAGVDRTIVLDQHDRLGLSPGLRSQETVELLQMGDEIAAALGRAGMDDELARDVIERPQHRDLLGLPRRRHPQVRPRLRPGAGEIGMRQRLALIALREEQCRPLRPAVCAVAGAAPPVPPRFPSDVPSACAGAAASGTFFSQGLGQLRTADAHALARFDLGAEAGNRPVAPVGHRFFQQRGDDAQGGFTLHRRRAWRDAGLQRCDTAGGEVDVLVTDQLPSYAAAKSELRLTARHEQGRARSRAS